MDGFWGKSRGREGKTLKNVSVGKMGVDATDREGMSALHSAAKRGEVLAMRNLLQAGANINAQAVEMEGETPLHFAAAAGHRASVDASVRPPTRRPRPECGHQPPGPVYGGQ